MKVTAILILVETFGTIAKYMEKRLVEVDIRGTNKAI